MTLNPRVKIVVDHEIYIMPLLHYLLVFFRNIHKTCIYHQGLITERLFLKNIILDPGFRD
jgi:hypothetical protein